MKPAAVIFDLFGTLLNIASLEAAAAHYVDDPAGFVATWRAKQLAYAFASTMMERYEDFDGLTARALRYAAARHGLPAENGGWEELADEWRRVQPYDDAADALGGLRAGGFTIGVLTNGTPQTASAALQAAGFAAAVDVTLSVDAVRVYKPDARVYALATAHYAVAPADIVFVTSNGWDATGAAEFGFEVIWCNRAHAPAETFGAPPAHTVATLDSLPEILAQRRLASSSRA